MYNNEIYLTHARYIPLKDPTSYKPTTTSNYIHSESKIYYHMSLSTSKIALLLICN